MKGGNLSFSTVYTYQIENIMYNDAQKSIAEVSNTIQDGIESSFPLPGSIHVGAIALK